METDSKPTPLPAKLRWRPYANGTSKKNSTKPKKTDNPGPNPKAIAHKIRPSQYYSTKPNHAPVKVSLQWEEAETVESMSHGGHPHNQHQYHHRSFGSTSSRDSSPGASSDISLTSPPTKQRALSTGSSIGNGNGNGNGDGKGNNVLTSAMQRAMASLPSPPPSKPLSSGLDLVGGPTDFNLFKASIPGLTGSSSVGQHAAGLDSLTPNNAYQIALNALFQSQTIKHSTFHTPALIDAPLTNNSANAASAASLLGSSTIHDTLLNDPNRVLSNEELLGVSSIDELLASCGVVEGSTAALTTQMLASPTDTNTSVNTSPLTSLLDFNNSGMVARDTSPSCPNTFSPMALTNQSFEVLLAQSTTPQSFPLTQQQQAPINPNTTALPATGDLYGGLVQALSSPFGYLSTGDPFTTNAPTAWPSLFPTFLDDNSMAMDITTSAVIATTPQKSEMATQTEGPYVTPLSPESTASTAQGSQRGTPSPLSTALGLSDEELDPDWLSFLDEASPLFNEADMPSPPPSGDESTPYSQTTATKGTEQRTRSSWTWGSAVPPAGHRGLPSTPSMTGIPGGSIANGGLIRTLQGTAQQKSVKSTKASVPMEAASTKESEAQSTPAQKSEPKQEDGFGGIISMIKGLWVTKSGGGDNDK
ncbi:hypothetical protein BGX33_004596 [Mortierella sp. NVP41]|nr:hypothetical protein BGX33_004596 [Mortierella sp. NVP41]